MNSCLHSLRSVYTVLSMRVYLSLMFYLIYIYSKAPSQATGRKIEKKLHFIISSGRVLFVAFR